MRRLLRRNGLESHPVRGQCDLTDANTMDKLFPIIRRKRRPLFVADAPQIPTQTAPVQPVAEMPVVEPAKILKADDGKKTSNRAAP